MKLVKRSQCLSNLVILAFDLTLFMQYAACLTGGSFDEARMLQNIEACEWLTGALRGLEVPNLDPCYANNLAVRTPLIFFELVSSFTLRRLFTM